jgi:hypothetical protein
VRALDEAKRRVRYFVDIFIFCYLLNDTVAIVGFANANTVYKSPIVPGIQGQHFNYELDYSTLTEISKL